MTSPGATVEDVITWVRRIIKSPNSDQVPDTTIQDYINRFYTYDVPARLQLFELKRRYTFETVRHVFQYQFPYNDYQMILPPAYCDGVQIGYYQSNQQFYSIFPEFVNNQFQFLGRDISGPYTVTFQKVPVLPGFIDDLGNLEPYVFITTTDVNGNGLFIVDTPTPGNPNIGTLIQTDATFQNIIEPNAGTINYVTGACTFTFDQVIPATSHIHTQTSPYSAGVPRIMLFFNNVIKLYPVPERSYKIQVDAYITPAQFLSTSDAIPFTYMSEYIAVGAARKMLRDNADYEMYQFYTEQLREMENQVLRRTDRQNSTQRTPTIFCTASGNGTFNHTQY